MKAPVRLAAIRRGCRGIRGRPKLLTGKLYSMNPLISPSWLANHLDDPGTVVFDATLPPVGVDPTIDPRARYLAKHIPDAIFFDIEQLSDRCTPLPHMLPAPEVFAPAMSSLGVSNQMTIVIYEQEGVFSAPRAWFMLRTFGAKSVYLLDGGLRAWIEAGLPTFPGEVQRPSASFHAEVDHRRVKSLAEIREIIAVRPQILDARSAGRFNGTSPEPRAGIRSGHMPGAINVPFTELLEHGRFKPAEKLLEVFTAKGVDLEQSITTTCGSGITAAVVALGLEIVGAKYVSLYDGSWAEYATQGEADIAES